MQKTDLNVAPYYDDFDVTENFHRVLFRPGFAVQARELTTLQSILQNQVERHGRHMFKEGSLVVPGQFGYINEYYAVKLQSTYNATSIADYLQQYAENTNLVDPQDANAKKGVIITGATSGVKARVIGFSAATTTDPATLYVKYLETATNTAGGATAGVTTTFVNGENISADTAITYTPSGGSATTINANVASATLQTSSATATGSSASIETGVYFIRGTFVRVEKQRIILDKYTNSPSYRIGLSVTETLVTPESDGSLLDNATGSSNENAKGAHRLQYTLTLSKLALGSAADENFVEIATVKNGVIQEVARNTDYSVLGETFARRTFDESGNYTVKEFGVDLRENLDDGLNEGVYASGSTTDDGNTSSENFLNVQVSPGKAYVRGYEIETVAPKFIDVEKPRTTEEFDSAITNAEVGNFVRVTNVYGGPDISSKNSASEIAVPYREIRLRDAATSSRGSAAGADIGVARARAFEHASGLDANSDNKLAHGGSGGQVAQFNLYLFDIRMFTNVVLSGTPDANHCVQGAKVTGSVSGATGFIHALQNTILQLTNVVGTFLTTDNLLSSSSDETDGQIKTSANNALTVSSVVQKQFDQVKQVFMDDPTNSDEDFTADLVLNTTKTLTGTVSTAGSGTTVTGFGTAFQTELRAGDVINISGIGTRIVNTISSDTSLAVTVAPGSVTTTVPATRTRPALQDTNRNILLRKLRKNNIKTLKTDSNSNNSVTALTLRRQYVTTSNGSGQIAVTAAANETFQSASNVDYIAVVLDNNSAGGCADGDVINLTATTSSFNISGNQLTITNTTVFNASGIKVKLLTTVRRTAAEHKVKTKVPAHIVLVNNISGNNQSHVFGVDAKDKDISLGKGDTTRIHAIFDSESTSADPALPQFTATGISGTFTKGERIVGGTSNAQALIIGTTSPITYIVKNAKEFSAGETITGQTSGATATVGTLTAGSKNITNRFILDTGQRDNFYDIGRIIRKAGATAPTGRIAVVFDYFEHGAGDFFTVDSYSAINYKDILTYSATRVDPEVREPTGEYDLRNAIDFRPKVGDVAKTTATRNSGQYTADNVTGFSFNFAARAFNVGTASEILIPKDNSTIAYDFEFFLGRVDLLFLTEKGEFKIQKGTPAENPEPPEDLQKSMLISEITLPAYLLDIDDAKLTKETNKRYTMRDIGRLEDRINNIEYYTALSLLEKDAESFQVQDANGLDRFKSGFLVDNFSGHSIGDVQHPDYRVAIDMEEQELRPKYFMKGVSLLEENTTDAQRTLDKYQKTGDMITLPYSEIVTIQQPYATRIENLNPVLNFSWAGICQLSPSGDEWFEVNRLPALVINREGNFDTVFAQNRNAIGTVWNAWQTQWSGTSTTRGGRFREHRFINLGQPRGRAVLQRVTTTQTGTRTRQGIQTNVVPQIDRRSEGDRLVSTALIPFIRARNVTFKVTGLKPLTRVYPFFDKQNVTANVTPSVGGTGTVTSAGGAMFSNGFGKVEGVFSIPDPNVAGNPRFRTGERVFRLTSSATNQISPEPETFAQATYSARGILRNIQERIIATRNARVEVRNVSTTENVTRTDSRDEVVGWWDPLAQSIMPQAEGGEYITKIDVFFQGKDPSIPVTCQLREMENGYPTVKALPFGTKVYQPFEDGLVSMSNGSRTVTGTNTKFTELGVGDFVHIGGAGGGIGGNPAGTQGQAGYDPTALVVQVESITSDTSMVVSSASSRAVTNVTISRVIISNDASTPTTFRFDSPVYVRNGVEYCIVLQSDSDKYFAWISRMGETDIGGTRTVSEQPYLGVLFKSQNNTTWSAYDFEDLKFTVHRASFETGTSGTLTLVNDVLPSKTLENDPLRFTASSNVVKVLHNDHHMFANQNNVTISGVKSDTSTTLNGAITNSATSLTLTSGTGFEASNLSSRIYLKIGNEIMFGTQSGGAGTTAITSLTRAQDGTTATAHANGATVELYQLNGIPLDQINKTHTATANQNLDYYTITTTSSADASVSVGGGNAVVATENAQMDGMQTLLPTIIHPNTTLSGSVRATSGKSPGGAETSLDTASLASNKKVNITLGENFFFDNPKMVASQINETNELSGSKSFFLDLVMGTTQENLSPIIDLDRKSIVAFANRIDNIDGSSSVYPTTDFVAPTEPDGDSTEAVYVTRKVTLKNPATALKVLHTAVRFANAEIQVMFKILRSDDESDFDELGFRFFNTNGGPDVVTNDSTTDDDHIEYEYTANDLEEFTAFAIKIRMQSSNSSQPPRIKDLRAIALAT